VDALNPVNMGLLLRGEPAFLSCTPAGIQQLLLRSGNDPAGKHVVICGRSNIVGKPLAAILMQKRPGANATVTICHTGTRDLATITRQADILVAAMGVPRGITADMVREGAVVIDVGNNGPTPSQERHAYGGRRRLEAVAQKAAAIIVPGGWPHDRDDAPVEHRSGRRARGEGGVTAAMRKLWPLVLVWNLVLLLVGVYVWSWVRDRYSGRGPIPYSAEQMNPPIAGECQATMR
jgi:hypothetical protein